MKEENVSVITDRDELYDKCENMEQLFSSYYLPLLEVHYRKTYDLKQENKSLQSQLKAKEEVIKEAIKIIKEGLDFDNPQYATETEERLLEILSKGENK